MFVYVQAQKHLVRFKKRRVKVVTVHWTPTSTISCVLEFMSCDIICSRMTLHIHKKKPRPPRKVPFTTSGTKQLLIVDSMETHFYLNPLMCQLELHMMALQCLPSKLPSSLAVCQFICSPNLLQKAYLPNLSEQSWENFKLSHCSLCCFVRIPTLGLQFAGYWMM